MPQYYNSLDSDIMRALVCIETEYELRRLLYKEFLKNFNMQHSRRSYRDFVGYFNHGIWPKTYPKANGLLSLFMPPYLNLFQNSPLKANIAAWGRSLGVFLAATIIAFPTSLITILICAALLVSGSLFYLGMAAYDYFKTPKPLRTNLQRFNMLSSIPSTLLLAGFCVASICASLALPGASVVAFSFYIFWAILYKTYQHKTGARIKTGQYELLEKGYLNTKKELNVLMENPVINYVITSILALTGLQSSLDNRERQIASSETLRVMQRNVEHSERPIFNGEPIIRAQNDMPQEVIVIAPDNQVSLGIYRRNFFESAQTTGRSEERYPMP